MLFLPFYTVPSGLYSLLPLGHSIWYSSRDGAHSDQSVILC